MQGLFLKVLLACVIMCYTIPILKTEEEFWSLDEDKPSVNEVKDVPDNFKDWIRDNSDRIEKATERGTPPYFIKDKREVVDEVLAGESEKRKVEKVERERIEANRKEYECLSADSNYTDVVFNPENGGLKATHKKHNIDKNKGWYEKTVQETGYRYGHSVILEKEIHNIEGQKNVEGIFDGLSFEIAAAETGIPNNIRNALKHCASKPNCEVAVIFFPDESKVQMSSIREGSESSLV